VVDINRHAYDKFELREEDPNMDKTIAPHVAMQQALDISNVFKYALNKTDSTFAYESEMYNYESISGLVHALRANTFRRDDADLFIHYAQFIFRLPVLSVSNN
jgi:hypothetical protein